MSSGGETNGSSFQDAPGSDLAEEIAAQYADRLIAGEKIDADEILSAHPTVGPEVLEHLEVFVGVGSKDSDCPLGTLGDYTLRRQIGRGGMGVVYDAWQGSLDRQVALKVLPPGVAADTNSYTRFLREAQIAAKISHPHVVSVYGFGVESNSPYYAMEFVDGETLAQVLWKIKEAEPETDTPFGKKDSVVYFGKLAEAFADVADGLQHAHCKGVIHRDIKPSNLILDSEGRLRILDFGLARLEGQESLTISGDLVGTLLYMSPEQARQKKILVDHRTDVYSLGATMYEFLCGRPPFQGKDHHDTLSQIMRRDPREPRKINPRVPRELETIVLKCLRKDAVARYGTAEALAQDLRRFVRGDPVEARPVSGWERLAVWLGSHRVGILTVLSILGLLFLAAWLGLKSHWADLERLRETYPHRVRQALVHLKPGLSRFGLRPFSDISSRQVLGTGFRAPLTEEEIRWMLDDSALRPVEEAARVLADLVEGLPEKLEAHFYLAQAYSLLDRPQEAELELRKTLDIDPGFTPARVLVETGDPAFATDSIQEEGTETAPRHTGGPLRDWTSLWLRAYHASNRGDWSTVVKAGDDLIAEYSDGKEPYIGFLIHALLARGAAHLQLANYDLAQADFAAVAYGMAPSCLEAHLMLAKAYHLAAKAELAEHTLRRLLARDRQRPEPIILSIVALYTSLAEYEEARRWGETLPTALRERVNAFLFLRLEKWQEAVEAGRKAVWEDPENFRSNMLLAAALKNTIARGVGGDDGQYRLEGELLRVAERSVMLAPDSQDARFLLQTAQELCKPLADSEWTQQAPLIDDFVTDPDFRDCTPICWQAPSCCSGDFSVAADGAGLELVKSKKFDGFLLTERVFRGNVGVRMLGAFSEGCSPDAQLAVAIHWDWQRGGLYYGNCRPTGMLVLRKFVPPWGNENDTIKKREIEIDPSLDVELELRSVGRRVEFRVWQPEKGDPRPEEALLVLDAVEDSLTWGPVGFGGHSRDGPPLRIRSVAIFE